MSKARPSSKGRGGARTGAGAHGRPADQRRVKRVMLSLTESEYERLVEAAGDDPISVFARRMVFEGIRRR